ncbi:Uncharacterized protein HZ326_19565 [Fusarium oxysporum f. sp. albedinis]|nr:Uncharacterized protein HZ326_19565 [Fusarium oxysporum f. sp. albedinis]
MIDTRAMGAIMIDLMGEDSDIDESAGTSQRPKQPMGWSAEAIDFLALTTTASGDELAKVTHKMPSRRLFHLRQYKVILNLTLRHTSVQLADSHKYHRQPAFFLPI